MVYSVQVSVSSMPICSVWKLVHTATIISVMIAKVMSTSIIVTPRCVFPPTIIAPLALSSSPQR